MLKVDSLSIHYPRFSLQDVSMHVEKGEYFILFGPTGSGKTLMFEIITGIRKPAGGRVIIGEKDLTFADPGKRNIGYVPQDYALIPFKNVYQNIVFGLEARRISFEEREKRVTEILKLLRIEHLEKRMPGHLSGGEKQRVALGRALAVQPDILLLDEPLSAVDENTGDQLMREIKNLHRKLNVTILHICHRLEEAFFLADKMAVIRDGKIVQRGTPRDIYNKPLNAFVANLLKVKNIVPGEVQAKDGKHWFYLGGQPISLLDKSSENPHAVIPPEKLSLSYDKPSVNHDINLALECTVWQDDSWKPFPELVLDAGFRLTIPRTEAHEKLSPSDRVWAVIPKEDILVLPE